MIIFPKYPVVRDEYRPGNDNSVWVWDGFVWGLQASYSDLDGRGSVVVPPGVLVVPFVGRDSVRVDHNRGEWVSVSVWDVNGNIIIAEIRQISLNSVDVVFNGIWSGKIVVG